MTFQTLFDTKACDNVYHNNKKGVSKMKSLLEDLILSEKNKAFSNISSQLILLTVQYENYSRRGATLEDIHKCIKDLSNEIWDSMFLEQKLREKYKEVQ